MTDLVVVTSQLPFDLNEAPDGTPVWVSRPGGLRAALGRELTRHATWIGWAGAVDVSLDPFVDDGMRVVPVTLSADEVRDHLEGFANATVWPLYHDALQRPVFDRGWWEAYFRVNRRYAEAVAGVAAEGATVVVHDYPLQLVPAILRELRPDLVIAFFMDTPFPPTEVFMRLPWRVEILRGLLGADLIGFHRPGGAQNFLWLTRRLIGLEPSRGAVGVRSRPGIVQIGDRSVRVGAFPGSADTIGVDKLACGTETERRARQIRESLGDPRYLVLGVERLGHTKGIGELTYTLGIDTRLQAMQELLAEGALAPEEVVVVELTVLGTHADARHYRQLRRDVERVAARINGMFPAAGHRVVHYLQQPMDLAEQVAFYRAADLLTITPLRDGMSVVAKEFVAANPDLAGALVLSEFSGAAADLTSAFLVNPHDMDGVKNAIHAALYIDPAEGKRRMRTLRRQVLTHDGDRWARSFLNALEPRPGEAG